MGSPLWKLCCRTMIPNINAACGSVRSWHQFKGKPPGVAKSLEQKMKGKSVVNYYCYVFH